ncbi:MAG: MFS transporter [Desulfotignum sp.]|nr:MFS transporter [Desulfotignum sp.]
MQKSILFTILSAIFIVFVGMGIIAPILPIYAEELGATGFALGVIMAAYAVSGGLLQPFVGSLSDRHGKKGFLTAGLIMFGLTGYIYTIVNSVGQLVLVRFFHGAGSALIFPIAMAYIIEASAEDTVGKYMGWFNIAIFAGIGAGPVLGGFFLDLLGKNAGFYAMAVLSFISAALVIAILPGRDPASVTQRPVRIFDVFRLMMHSRRVMGILLARMATMIIMVPTFAFLPLLMTRQMGASGSEIGMVIASRTLVNAVLQVPFGKLADTRNQNRLLLAGTLLIGVTIFCVPFTTGFVPLLLLFAVIGLGEAISWPAMGALAAKEGKKFGQGSMMGVFNMAMNLGVFIGAMGVGALVDLFSIAWAFYAVGICLIVCAAASAAMIRHKSNPTGKPLSTENG